MNANYSILLKGEIIYKSEWVDADNSLFQSVEDARDWGDELVPTPGKFEILNKDGITIEVREWLHEGDGIYSAHSRKTQ
jgi:hypothetical protein